MEVYIEAARKMLGGDSKFHVHPHTMTKVLLIFFSLS